MNKFKGMFLVVCLLFITFYGEVIDDTTIKYNKVHVVKAYQGDTVLSSEFATDIDSGILVKNEVPLANNVADSILNNIDEATSYILEESKNFVQENEEQITEDVYYCCGIRITSYERYLVSTVVMNEAGILSMEAKYGIVSVIFNRLRDPDFPNTIQDVIMQEYQFATGPYEPDSDCYKAVDTYSDGAFPEDMFWFRTDYYHTYGYPYCIIGNTYFNTREDRLTYSEGDKIIVD